MTIRKINPPDLHPTAGYSHVNIVDHARFVFLAGQIPLSPSGDLVGPDLEDQVDQTVSNVLTALAAAGATPEHVVRTVVYVASADTKNLALVWQRLNRSALAPAFSTASTLIGVTALAVPGQLVEVEVTATIADQ